MYIQRTGLTLGTAPSSSIYGEVFLLHPEGSLGWANVLGYVSSGVETSNKVITSIGVRQNSTSSNKPSSNISISVDDSGNISTSAPTPATSSNDTNIATTAFVNNRISDIESKLSYVGVTNDVEGENVSGNKTGLVINPINTSYEGGQIVLRRSSSSFYNTIIDIYSNEFRVFQNAASNGRMFKISFADNATVGSIGGKEIATIQTGTWTPVLSGKTTEGSINYTIQSGVYFKIGKLCFIRLAINYTITTAPTGQVIITGLPFTTANFNENGTFVAIANGMRKLFGGFAEANTTRLGLIAVSSDSPWLKDSAIWGTSSSDTAGYKVYGTGVIYMSGVYMTS